MKILTGIKTIKSYLPVFSGFYNSVFEADEEIVIEYPFDYDDYKFDYTEYNKKVSEVCCEAIQTKLSEDFDINLTIEFENLYSPKEYNFSTDSINCTYILKANAKKAIAEYLKKNIEAFDKFIIENCTSRSGFISFFSNDYNVWLTEYLNDEKKLETCFGRLLSFIFENEGYTDSNLWDDINTGMNSFHIEGWLNDKVQNILDLIEKTAVNKYATKNMTELTSELYNEFESENLDLEHDWLTYNFIEEIVNKVFTNIDNKTLSLFA